LYFVLDFAINSKLSRLTCFSFLSNLYQYHIGPWTLNHLTVNVQAPSPCTSKTSSVSLKKDRYTIIYKSGWNSLGRIYWVTNLLHPQQLTLLVFFSFRVSSFFIPVALILFSVVLFCPSFIPWSIRSLWWWSLWFVSLLFLFFKEWCLFSSYLYFCIALCYWRLYQWFFERSWLCVPG